MRPSTTNILNHTPITGPNVLPTTLVPKRWKKKIRESIAITTVTVTLLPGVNTSSSPRTLTRPSMAEATEIGGVMIPSANKVAAPILAGMKAHQANRRTSAYREKIPPSPRLSARRVSRMYLNVVWIVNVQTTQLIPPKTRSSDIRRSPIMAFITYNGEVPMSP